MPELWENCNNRSQAVLIQLYWEEYGCCPDFYYVLKGEKQQPDIINAPLHQEEEEMEIDREIREKPHHQERLE